jgi:hypothetical protein
MIVGFANNFRRSNDMPGDDRKRSYRRDMLIAATLVATGLVISALSLSELARKPQQMVQVTPPLQSTPGAETKPSAPAEPTTTGTGKRPPDVPPEPARPDSEAQKSGAQSVLPPAPAEKTAPPIKEK